MTIFATTIGRRAFVGPPDLPTLEPLTVTREGCRPFEVLRRLSPDAIKTEEWREICWLEKIVGSLGEGEKIELTCGMDYEDKGQLALLAVDHMFLSEDARTFWFRVDYDDAEVGGSPSQRFFQARLDHVKETLDLPRNVLTVTFALTILSCLIRVHAKRAGEVKAVA